MSNKAATQVAQHEQLTSGGLLRVGVCSSVPREGERGDYEVVALPTKYWNTCFQDSKHKVEAMMKRRLDTSSGIGASFNIDVFNRKVERLDSTETPEDYRLKEETKGEDLDVWMKLPPNVYAAYAAAMRQATPPVGPPATPFPTTSPTFLPIPPAGDAEGAGRSEEDVAATSCAGAGAVPSLAMLPESASIMDATQAEPQAEPQPSQPPAFDPTKVYDVFLCHSGTEKHGIVSIIKSALERHGLTNFLDVESLVMGQFADETIRPALKAAKAIVMVVSIDFLERPYCMGKEARWVVEDNTRLKAIPVFYNVSRRECSGEMSERVRQRLEKGGNETAEWTETLKALAKMGNIDKLDDTIRLTDAKLVDEVVKYVEKNLGHGNQLLPVYLADSSNGHVEHFYDLLKTGGYCALCGQGGIGKTTLARAVFNKLKASFDYTSAAVEVGQDTTGPLLLQCANKLLAQLDLSPVQDLQAFTNRLNDLGSPFLLLLDDVWEAAQIDVLFPRYDQRAIFQKGSVVLCTSRFKPVLLHAFKEGECHEVRVLSDEEASKLLRWHVFGSTEATPTAALQTLEQDVLVACAGLPLALEIVGRYISRVKQSTMLEVETWQGVLNALKQNREEVDTSRKLEGILELTLRALNMQCRDMFLDVACILDGYPKQTILSMWEGVYVGETACTVSQWLGQLLGSSLVREELPLEEWRDTGSILVVHDVLRYLGKQEVKKARDPSEQRWLMDSAASLECVAQGKVSPNLRALQLAGYPLKSSEDGNPIQLKGKLNVLILQNIDGQPRLPPTQFACTLAWLDLSFANFKNIPPAVLEMTNLRVLHLSGCKQLTEVPHGMCNLRKLRCLVLSGCEKLRTIPEGLGCMTNLKYLDLSFCRMLETLPEGISCLSSLQTLDLYQCRQLLSLPEGISGLSNLQTLELSGCRKPKTLPEGVSALNKLQTLGWFHCQQLHSLPKGISGLSSLQKLELSECEQLKSLPEGISGLGSLQTLTLSDCKELKSLPDGISGLCSLQIMVLYGCKQLQSLPEGISGLSSLDTLMLFNGKQLHRLPKSISSLRNLRELNLTRCSLLKSSLLEGISGLCSLQTLELSDCKQLESLPKSISSLSNLQTLGLRGCMQLRGLPEGISGLSSLKTLDLIGCEQLHSLPETISRLSSLLDLFLFGCKRLQTLPQGISSLSNLKTHREFEYELAAPDVSDLSSSQKKTKKKTKKKKK